MTRKSIFKTQAQPTGPMAGPLGPDGRPPPSSQASPLEPRRAPAVAVALLEWYDRHARTLPWRVSPADRARGVAPDPYRVWLSEVMLQQTTVAAVKSYFAAFTERWPTVQDLAAASDPEVMGAWAGLGYYARARNLLACARAVTLDHDGRFPETSQALRALPGIGEYTSAAIAAIAFDEPAAVVDGNIERVTTRLHAIETPLPAARKAIRLFVESMTPRRRPGDFAQAMMDLGATICTPKRPACVLCPIAVDCQARIEGRQEIFPIKLAKKAKPSRVGAVFVARRASDGAIWLRRRPDVGLLGGMSEPPSTDWNARRNGAVGREAAPFPAPWRASGQVAHGFTHFDLVLDVWAAELASEPKADGWWATPAELETEALPTLMRKAILAATPVAPRPGKPSDLRQGTLR